MKQGRMAEGEDKEELSGWVKAKGLPLLIVGGEREGPREGRRGGGLKRRGDVI